MNRCDCGFLAKSAAGLAAHRRQKHPETGGPNRRAVERMLVALRFDGRLSSDDAAREQLVRSLADELDRGEANAALWKVYREAINDMTRQDDAPSSSFEQTLAQIRSAASLGDPPAS